MTAEQTKIAEESHVKAPWLNVYGVVPPHLDYPDCTMYEAVERCAGTYPNHTAYVFMGRKTTYRAMAAEIDLCARARPPAFVPATGSPWLCPTAPRR